MHSRHIASTAALLLALGACTTPEEIHRADAAKLRALPQGDFVALCGQIGEFVLERMQRGENAMIVATAGPGAVRERTDRRVVAESPVDATGPGFLSTRVDFVCTFDPTLAIDDRWYRLTALRMQNKEMEPEAVAFINRFGASLMAVSEGAAS
ncbi:MAG: hypothetical protein KDE35_06085 [Geminicoccaceae bacterium]|nr:hypothetical protein [Geminicoccaceae bacterium]